jgi:transposase-like protein
MSAVVTLLSAGEAQRLTQRIKLTATVVRDNLFKLKNLVEEAKSSNAWTILGYASWTAYLADTLGDEPMRLGREERQELVGYLAGEGLSVRAIAPIVGVDPATVSRDRARVADATPEPEPDFDPTPILPPRADDWIAADAPDQVNTATGEIIDAPVTTTETHMVKTVVGLDGKNYTQKPRESKPVPVGDAANKLNAIQTAKDIGNALETFLTFSREKYRARILNDWWPLGKEAVLPATQDLFNPAQLRQIAESLEHMATEMENQNV